MYRMHDNSIIEVKRFLKKVYYLGYYGDPTSLSNRKITPAADVKMTYIIETMKKIGYDVEVLSFCIDEDRKVLFEKRRGYKIDRNHTPVVFFDNYTSKYRILRVIGRWMTWLKIKRYLKIHCINSDCKILIYHSLGLLKVLNFLNKKKKPFILEMEEIYADVIGKKRIRIKEINAAQKAAEYMFPTQLLSKIVNPDRKPEMIIHGTYGVEPDRKCNVFNQDLKNGSDRVIHCVYAGTLDPRKGGAEVAAEAATFLPKGYHIHILGFGTKQDVQNMQNRVKDIASRSKAKLTYDGVLYGEEYIRFIQSCDIGLSTQNPDAAFNGTSFPSKILSYMANGVQVVSIRIPVVESSAVGAYLYYYDHQIPEEIAKTIMSVNVCDKYVGRKVISELNIKFRHELEKMLDENQ